jgi:hypothetical protein
MSSDNHLPGHKPPRPAPATSIPAQKRATSTHPLGNMASTTSYNPPRSAQTRSMTKLAQGRKHLETFVQIERNGGKTMFGGVVRGKKRGPLLDSFKNVQQQTGDQEQTEETSESAGKGFGLGSGTAAPSTLDGLPKPGQTSIPSFPSQHPAHRTPPKPSLARPNHTISRQPNHPSPIEIQPGGFRMDDEDSEDELLLTPRSRQQKRRAPGPRTFLPIGKSRLAFGAAPTSSLASSSTGPEMTGATDDHEMTRLLPTEETLPQIKRKRPSHPSDSPSMSTERGQARARHGQDMATSLSPSPSPALARTRTRTRGQTEEPNIDTPERRHKGKRRRVSDSPSKILGGRKSTASVTPSATMSAFTSSPQRSVGERLTASGMIKPPTPPRKRVAEAGGFEPKQRTSGTLPSALGAGSGDDDVMQVDDVKDDPKREQARLGDLGFGTAGSSNLQARPSGSTTHMISSFPLKRPSYPSSLGPGAAPSRPMARNVALPAVDAMDTTAIAPIPRPSAFSSSNTSGLTRIPSRREGLGSDTKGSLYGLSAALAKLQVKASAPNQVEGEKRRLGGFAMPTASSAAKSIAIGSSEPGRLPGSAGLKRSSTMMGQRRVSSLAGVGQEQARSGPTQSQSRATSVAPPDSQLVRSGTIGGNLQNLIESDAGTGCLKGVVAYVDVRTAEGDDAGMVFAEMLRYCGAKVSVHPRAD